MSFAVILLAAGSGNRMKQAVADKLLLELLDRPVFQYSLRAFAETGLFTEFIIVFRDPQQKKELESIVQLENLTATIHVTWSEGGKRRQDSVWRGLVCCPESVHTVFIHDCARPLITPEILVEMANMSARYPALCLAHRIKDTLKQTRPAIIEGEIEASYLRDLNRDALWGMETPQVFKKVLIQEAYRRIMAEDVAVTDDTAALEPLDIPVKLVENLLPNNKITTPGDIALIEFLLTHKNIHTF